VYIVLTPANSAATFLQSTIFVMRRILAGLFLLCLSFDFASGEIISFVESPHDELGRLGGCNFICEHPELQPFLKEYNKLIASRISPLKQMTNVVAVFGPKLSQRPKDRAKPLFVPWMIVESGVGAARILPAGTTILQYEST
jgi:hypothetical protein